MRVRFAHKGLCLISVLYKSLFHHENGVSHKLRSKSNFIVKLYARILVWDAAGSQNW